MDELRVTGLVVREVDVGEYDKILTLVTAEQGKVSVTAKGARSLKSKHIPTTGIFAYGTYILKQYKTHWYLADSELIESFYALRTDVAKLALAAYIADVCAEMCVEEQSDEQILRLTLNSLYAAANDVAPLDMIKAAFELKAMALGGFCPDLVACSRCGKHEASDMYLDIMNGSLVCPDCRGAYERKKAAEDEDAASDVYAHVTPPVLDAMRHIAYADQKKMLSFTLDEDSMIGLSQVCEKYLLNQMEHDYYSLTFYKSVK